MNEEIVEIHTIARGQVQGVGFRYTTQRIARQYGIKGTVKNLTDGTVEIYAQGPRKKVELFSKALEEQWEGYLEPLEVNRVNKLNSYKSFEIIF